MILDLEGRFVCQLGFDAAKIDYRLSRVSSSTVPRDLRDGMLVERQEVDMLAAPRRAFLRWYERA